jgi:hypothetical protein
LSTISTSALRSIPLAAIWLAAAAHAGEASIDLGGHSKTWLLADGYPGDSAFHQLTGSNAASLQEEIRLNLAIDRNEWRLDAAWQLYATWGDRVDLLRQVAASSAPGVAFLPNDDRRLMNLTDTLHDDGNFAAVQRLDRLAVTWAGERLVIRAGRQAITWGNGLAFAPMDIVNPFDPATIDTEFKFGDDMVYAQYLLDGGDDVEFAHVLRRDVVSGDVAASESTTAAKYHGIAGDAGYDLLVGRHRGDATVGIGGNRSVGGAVVHGDVVWIDTDSGGRLQVVTNVSYSWVWKGRNMSGFAEYYFSEFGQRGGRYDLESLSQNTALLERLERGESFTLGRNYLAAGVTIELTPLWQLTPNLFANLDDGSALLQLVSRNSLGDEVEFLGALNLPVGPGGSEYGGIETGIPGVYLSSDFSVFAQVAWYF